MRARSRPVVAVAAVAAASIPLWASAAGAGESYDEFNHTKKTVTVSGVACEIAITSYRQGTTVYASTYMQTPAPECATYRVYASLEFLTEHGDTASASSLDDGPGSVVSGGAAVDLVRSSHTVIFASGPTVTYTLTSK